MSTRIRNLKVGVESISRWRVDDEHHLPAAKISGPAFLPKYRPLDEILRRPSLDERLPDLLQPETLDPDMLEPAVLTRLREESRDILRRKAGANAGGTRRVFENAAQALDRDVDLDYEISAALAALLQG